jgi:hypothetical protein
VALKKRFTQQLDRFVLRILSRGMAGSVESIVASPTLAEIVGQTRVKRRKTILYNLVAPGEHPIWLETPFGEIRCLVKVRLALRPDAPLLLYHHGFAEIPYTSTWNQLLPPSAPFPAHTVAVQAPYHNRIREPFKSGFSSAQHVYQMFAGSLRIYELLQEQFEAYGAAFTVASGVSWGGITSLLYEGFFQRARATIPMFASPNLARVMTDGADLIGRSLPVPAPAMDELFNFTPICDRGDKERLFPVMGEDDLFFRFERHAMVYSPETVLAVPSAHVAAVRRERRRLRRHVLNVLDWAARNPR